MLRIRCWKGGSVQTTEVQGPRLDHRSTSPQYGSGRVAALTSYSQVRCGSGRCIGHRPRLREGPAMHRSQNRQAFKTRMGGVDARIFRQCFRRDSNPDWMRPWRIASTGWATKACAGNPQGYARAVHCGFDHSCRILHSCLRWTRILQHEA